MQTNNQAFTCCLRLLALLLWTCISPLHPTYGQKFDTNVICFALFYLTCFLADGLRNHTLGSQDNFSIKAINFVYSLIMQRIIFRPTGDVLSITRYCEEPAD